MSAQYDSRLADKFVVRLPDGMRSRVEAAANAADRSMNSVFIQALRQYLDSQHRQELLLEALAASVEKIRVNQTTDIPAVADSMHIDDRVRMAANARRYEWLRNVAATTGSGHTPMVKVAGGPGRWRVGDDLDQSIDQAMKAWPINEQDHDESAGRADIGRSSEDVLVAQVQQADIDPRNLFIAANPVSVAPGDLEKGRGGFVDHCTHADYLIFLAGYQAAVGGEVMKAAQSGTTCPTCPARSFRTTCSTIPQGRAECATLCAAQEVEPCAD